MLKIGRRAVEDDTMRRPAALAVLVAVLGVAVPATAAAAGPQKGRYDCYVFYAPGAPTSTGRAIKVVSGTRYSFFNGKAWKAGAYRVKGTKLSFTSGLLKGKPGTHRVYGNGTHGIDVQMTPGAAGTYACSRR